MNYLVHHEFGLSHKPMILDTKFQSDYDLNDINYWLDQWINLYNFAKNNFTKIIMFFLYFTKNYVIIQINNVKINNFIGENVFEILKDLNFKLKNMTKMNINLTLL